MTNPFNLDSVVKAYVQNTPVVKRYAKTIANVVGLLANALLLVAGLPISASAQVGVAVAIQALFAIAAYLVPNAITPAQATELQEYVGRHRSGE